MKMINEIIEIGGRKWKVIEAVSREAAENEIAMARCTGSVGGKRFDNGVLTAHVHVLNDDGTERQPS